MAKPLDDITARKNSSFEAANPINNLHTEAEGEETLLLGVNVTTIESTDGPVDRFYMAYVILFLYGIGQLLPWNMFITAHEYFKDRFTCPHSSSSSNHSQHCIGFDNSFESYFSVAATTSTVLMCGANIYLQSKISIRYRMFTALLATLILFIFTIVMIKVPSSTWVDGFFVLTVFTIVAMSVFGGLFESSLFGFAGMLPQKYISAVMGGQAIAGIFSSIVRIISASTVAAESGGITLSALVYFLIAAAVTLFNLVSFFLLLKLKFVKFHLKKSSSSQQRNSGIQGGTTVPFLLIFKKISVYGVSVFLVFVVTIGLFPAVVSNIVSSNDGLNGSISTASLFDALVCFLVYNCADFAGRILSNWYKVTGKWRYLLLLLTILRFLFVPLFLMCNVQPRSDHFPVLLTSDIWPVVINTLFGLTSGFFASLAMVSAPSSVGSHHRETASTMMAWFLTLGLLVGAGLSFFFTYIIRV